MVKAIIFDFDGTIADSFEIFVRAINTVLKRRKPLTKSEIAGLRKSSLKEVIKKLGVKKWQLPLLAIKGRREVGRHMDTVKVFDDIPEVLKELSSMGYKLYIVSSNGDDSITNFLNKYEISRYITRTWANIGLQGKVRTLKKLQRSQGFSTAECVYVGDETRDIEAANKASIRCIAVAWGFGNVNTLKSYGPSAIANQPKDLVKLLAAP